MDRIAGEDGFVAKKVVQATQRLEAISRSLLCSSKGTVSPLGLFLFLLVRRLFSYEDDERRWGGQHGVFWLCGSFPPWQTYLPHASASL